MRGCVCLCLFVCVGRLCVLCVCWLRLLPCVCVPADLISVKRDLISVKRDLISVKRDLISVLAASAALCVYESQYQVCL